MSHPRSLAYRNLREFYDENIVNVFPPTSDSEKQKFTLLEIGLTFTWEPMLPVVDEKSKKEMKKTIERYERAAGNWFTKRKINGRKTGKPLKTFLSNIFCSKPSMWYQVYEYLV